MGRISLLKPEPERPKNSWAHFKEIVVDIISKALLILRRRSDLVDDEKELNRVLYFCFVEAYANLELWDLHLPAPEAKNPPHPNDETRVESENKMPDLSWNLMNHEANHGDWHRSFVLECKRLGKETNAGWVFNEEYVTHGILRFFHREMGYGKGSETGAMAGYVQNVGLDPVLQEVNSHIVCNEPSIPTLPVPITGWQHQGVSYLSHTIYRPFVPTHFLLQHFWVDMQDCHFNPLPRKTKSTSVQLEEQMPDEQASKESEKAKAKRQNRKISSKKPPQLELPIEGINDT